MRGNSAPLKSAGEHVCNCLLDGEDVIPFFGRGHAREAVVRCKDCKYAREPQQGLPWMCVRNCCAHFPVEPDGFCAWGVREED